MVGGFELSQFLMKYFSREKYEIILADYEIKFAFLHLRIKYFIRVSVFHSEAISLAARRISLKKAQRKRVELFSGAGGGT